MRAIFVVFAAFAATALAGPTGPRSTCAIHCTNSETFRYATGKSYIYDYSVTTSTALLGTFDDDTQMNIRAQAHIDISSPCDFVLRLTDVNLEGSAQSGEFSEAIMKNPLRFSFQDGVVESLCSEESEPAWVLNFKRGVLSTFQNSMNHLNLETVKETDISGACTTHYDVSMEGEITTAVKVKDLASCERRSDLKTYIASTSYATDSPIQSLPIFLSTSKCTQEISEGLVRRIECEETHKFRPFSSEEGGAQTTVKSIMSLRNEEDAPIIAPDLQFSSVSLIFDDTLSLMAETTSDTIVKLLGDLKTASQQEISSEVPALFSHLVEALKKVNYPQLSNIYTNIQDLKSKKYFIDAMPLVGTSSSAGIVRDIIINGEMTEAEKDDWFASLAFLKNPDSEMFTALAPLLEGNPTQKAMLGTSALINNYCKIHSDCETDSGIIQVIRRIEAQLGAGCRAVNDEEKIKILVALKALGNAGRWVNANTILRRCYTEEQNSMEVRVAALEAWRHTPCEYDRSNIEAAYQDETQDPEIRIAAYLALMSCPTQRVIDMLKNRLISEGVNQVGSFVWTHLTNMQESASPEKQWMREMIGEEMLQKKFSTEALRFSRNYESSFFMNEINTGATIESNIIFSGKSFLPRSAMLNLTLDLFGQSLNFFEVGGRIEGFESYVERFFGPNGYFPEETVEGIIRNMRNEKSDYEPTTLEGFLDKATDEPEGSYYLRMLGNELHYHHFQGIKNIFSSSRATNPLDFIMELARKGNVDYSKSLQLFNTQYTIPTMSGLPLSLSAKGTATIGLQMNGNFKAKSFKNVNIEGQISPSAAVEIDALMLIDAHVTNTGLKVASNLHTSTYLDGKIKINKGKLVDIAFNTPKEKVEVIDVKTKFFYLEKGKEIEKGNDNMISTEGCTRGKTGFALCSGYSYTPRRAESPLFPLSGPFGGHIYFKKTDSQTGYVLRFEREQNEISFLVDTPGSQYDHKISIAVAKADNTLTFDIHTPFKSAAGNGEYIWLQDNKGVKVAVTVDGKQYELVGSILKDISSCKFEPSVVISSPNGELLNFNGIFQMGGQSKEMNVELRTPVFQTKVKSNFDHTESYLSIKTDAEYVLGTGSMQTIHYTSVVKEEVSDQVVTYSANTEFNLSQFPFMSFNLDCRSIISKKNNHIESTAKLVKGSETMEANHVLLFSKENGQSTFKSEMALKNPLRNIDYFKLVKLSFNRNSLQGEILARSSPEKEISLSLSLGKNRDVELLGNLAMKFFNFSAGIEGQYTKISSGYHKAQIIMKMNDETCIVEGTFKNSSTNGKMDAVLEGMCKCSLLEAKSTITINADKDKGLVDMKTNINNRDYTARLEGTRTSLLVDINIIKHLFFNAYTTSNAEANKVLLTAEWDKDVDPTKSFTINAEVKSKSLLLNIKVIDQEYLLSSKLLNSGAELEAKWAPNKKVTCNLEYRKGETTSFSASVHTPFQGWEKQDAVITVSVKDFRLNSRIAVTWKNSEQMSLTVDASAEPGMFTNAMTANILFTSSFDEYERITFLLDHSMNGLSINTKVEGKWDAKELRGKFNLQPNEYGIEGQLSFTSWLTEDLLITLTHALQNNALSSMLEAKLGSNFITMTLKGHVELSSAQNITLVFKIVSSTNTPELSANINFSNDGSILKLIVDGVMGDKKVMLNANGKLMRGETTKLMGDLRFITPFTYPLTASINFVVEPQSFKVELEMSRIWSTYGNLKLHVDGQMILRNNMQMNAVLSTPTNKASLSLSHKIEEKKMVSFIDAILNGERIHVSAEGTVDAASNLADLQAEIKSTFNDLDDIKVTVKSEKNGRTRTTNATFIKGEKSINIEHIITIMDLLNWENTFKLNGKYMLLNKRTQVGTTYSHDLRYIWDTDEVHLTLSFDQKTTGAAKEIDAKLTLASPWTENMTLDLHHTYGNSEFKPVIIFEYAPGRKIEISHVIRVQDAFVYIEGSLVTSFWQDLGYKLNIESEPKPAVTLVLSRGNNKTTIHTEGKWQKGNLDGKLEIESTYLSMPVSVEAAYDINSEEKSINLIINCDKRYEIKGLFSGDINSAKWMLMVGLPFKQMEHIEFMGEYNITKKPLTGKVSFTLNSMTLGFDGKVNNNEFVFNTDYNGKKASLSGKWFYSHTQSNILISFESDIEVANNASLYMMYDIEQENKINIKMTRGSSEVNLTGKLENGTLLFDGTTPLSGWEVLKGSFFISESAIKAFVARNERKIEVDGTLHVKLTKGRINILVTTPYANYESISADLVYSLKDLIKTVEFKSTFGTQELMLTGTIDITQGLAPEMKLDITTPFDFVKKVGGSIQWNLTETTKTALAKAYRNDREYQWQVEATANSLYKGEAEAKIITPIKGWASINIKGMFDITSMPYAATFTYEKEGLEKRFEGHLNLDHGVVTAKFITPINGWEMMELSGNYAYENNHLNFNTEIVRNSEKYQLAGDFLFNTQKTKFTITFETPISYASKVAFAMDTNFLDASKSFFVSLNINDDTFSMQFNWELQRKVGFINMKLLSPLVNYTNIETNIKFDFTGDIKTAEVDMKKEGQDYHISLSGRVNDNNIYIEMQTPFEVLEKVNFSGDYTTYNNEHILQASFARNGRIYNVKVDVLPNEHLATLKLTTPIEVMKIIEVEGKYSLLNNGMEASLLFKNSNEVFTFNTRGIFTPFKSDLVLSVETPITNWKKMVIDVHYDLESESKSASVLIQKDSFVKKVTIEGSYTLKSASFKIESPVEGFRTFGGAYTIDLNERNNQLDASVKLYLNSKEWLFSAHGQYKADEVLIRFTTPFEGFNTISAEGKINFDGKTGKGAIEFGTYKFTINVSYAPANYLLKLETPFANFKILSIAAKYQWAESHKDATLSIKFNEKNYEMKGTLTLSRRKSEFLLVATTPFQGFDAMTFNAKYDLDNRDELMSAKLGTNTKNFGFKLGGFVNEKSAEMNIEFLTPFTGWTNVNIRFKIDLNSDDKNIILLLERDGNMKEINISGKFIGDTGSFSLKTPFDGLKTLQMFGSLNRAKRSLEFRLQNDAAQASLITNFHSVSLHVKSPFQVAEEIKVEIAKVSDNTLKIEWKRNDNYIHINIERQGKKAAFNVEVKSEFQGWEFLALTGRLDRDEIRGYISGSVNEEKVVLSGSGQFDTKGAFNLHIETPYDNYKSVDANLEYNNRKRTFKLEASSSSSNFHLILERDRTGVITHHAIFPNPEKPTEITMNLGLYSGKVTITSRFPMIRDYYQEYNANIGPIITVDHIIKWNDLEVFKLDLLRDGPNKKMDLEMHFRRPNHHTTIEVHRDGFSSAHFLARRDNKEFRIDVKGTGNLPTQGELDIDINNSFREVPRHIKVKVTYNVAASAQRKQIKVEVSPSRSRLYIFDLNYSVDRSDYKTGDFNLAITTPVRSNAPWKNMSGSWNVQDRDNVNIKFSMGGIEYTAEGKFTVRESTLILVPTSPNAERIFLQWKFQRDGASRDYFLKLGRESRYGLFKLLGTITDYAHVDVEGGIKLGPFMKNEFLFTTNWNKDATGAVNGKGTFHYGDYHGEHTVYFKRDAATRSATFKASGTSNLPEYQTVHLSGNYNFNNKAVIHAIIHANDRESKIDVNIEDIKLSHSRNSININIPIFKTYGQMEVTLSHDIRNNAGKSIALVAKFPNREAYIKANWKRSDNFDTIEGTIDVKSRFVGEIHIKIDFDVSNINDAHAEATYIRKTLSGETKNASAKWTRNRTPDHLETELVIQTPFAFMKNGHISISADFSDIFHLSSKAQRNERIITFDLDVNMNSITGKITTPYANFELMKGALTFNFAGKTKAVHLQYERGTRKVEMDFTLNLKAKKEGDFVLNLATPFDFVETLHIDGKWSKKKAEINYKRNDLVLNFSGKADIKADKSSFDLSFDPPSGKTIRVAGSYDVKAFLEGSGSEAQKLASLELEFDNNKLSFNVNGFRSSDHVLVEIEGHTTFTLLEHFHMKLDSQLNTQLRDGYFELHVNDFEFKMHNHYERRAGDGYYLRSQVESTLTPLPALIFGLGREGEERILTIGYGEDREITFSIKGKDHFRKGFSGYVDIPNFGYEGVKYDLEYKFENPNELHIDLELELGSEGEVEAKFVYNSDGVQARFNSLRTGEHHLRFRRSVSLNSFSIETGVDDYEVKLRGGFAEGNSKKGFLLEGEVFGRKISIDTLLQSEGMKYTEGKFLIKTSFQGWENVGGLFTWAKSNKNIISKAEIHLPSYTTPKITAEINLNLDAKIEGYVTLNVAGEEFSFRSSMVGSLSEGYNGKIEIITPFHAISHVEISGNFKADRNSFVTDLKINAPLATHQVKLNWNLDIDKQEANAMIQSSRLSQVYNIEMKIEKSGPWYKKAYLNVNGNTASAEWNLNGNTFLMNFDSLIFGIKRQFAVEANFSSLQNLEGTLTVTVGENTHRIHGNVNISTNNAKAIFELESSLIEGKRAINFDFSSPNASYKQFSFEVTFVSDQSHTIHFDCDATSGVHITLKVDTPVFPKMISVINITPNSASFSLETPQGMHKLSGSWRVTRKMPADYVFNVEMSSPLLQKNYSFGIIFGGNQQKRMFKTELQAGNTKHMIEGMTFMSNIGGGFSLNIETPVKNINKGAIEAKLEFGSQVLLHISSSLANTVNTFDLSYDKANRVFSAVLESPFVPTEMLKAEAQLSGEINKNMKVKMDLSNKRKSVSGLLNVETISPENINMDLKITTPFKGYKKMSFIAQYKKTENITVLLSLDKPIKFTAQLQFDNFEDKIKAGIKVDTSIKSFETLEGSLYIPLKIFEPRVSAVVRVDNRNYGGHIAIRTKAPYELSYGLQIPNIIDNKFHLRTDSSFLSFLA
ncbi:hypothetical protein SK128_004352 [Halocaridina rubra]|uniref:Vitellogenin domain-containing protein n=1 Tax=Halocaridina rubra TaxID=373956 RepID=A0AAN8X0Z4_HALRR